MSAPYAIERRAVNRLPPAPPPGDAFGVRAAADAVLQHGRLALGVFLAVPTLAVLYLVLAAPVFRADTVIEISGQLRSPLLPSLANAERGAPAMQTPVISGEMEVLRSREVLLPVIFASGADIELSNGKRFGFLPIGTRHGFTAITFHVPDSQRGIAFSLTVAAGRWELFDAADAKVASGRVGEAGRFALDGQPAELRIDGPSDAPATQFSLRAYHPLKAYEEVLERLKMFEPSRESNVVRLSYEDTDPARAAAVLNGLVNRYLEESVGRRSRDSEKALGFLEAQLAKLKRRVSAAEDALRVQQGRGSATPFAAEAESTLRQRSDLERQSVELRIKQQQLAQTLTPQHPEMAAVTAQLATVQRALDRLQDNLRQFPEQQRELLPLQRELQISTQLYLAMLTHVQQLRLDGASGFISVRQLDAAVEPFEPVRPRAAAVLSIGAGVGLLLALLAVVAVRSLQPTVSDLHEYESLTSPATVGVIAQSEAQLRLMSSRVKDGEAIEELGTHRLLVRAAPDDPAVEGLRSVHLSLMLRTRSSECRVVTITAPSSGTGKAFIAANLAALMAEGGKRVLLIDSDMRNPGVHDLIGLDQHAAGLADLLGGQRSLDQVIHPHAALPMDVILQGTPTNNPGGILLSPALAETLATLRERYDDIVINAAPLLPSSDALSVGRLSDVVLLVVRAEQSLLRETRMAQRRLEQAGIRLEGILVNGVKRHRLNGPRLT
jgi:tyrosine-protein kinase Etk/Wzc